MWGIIQKKDTHTLHFDVTLCLGLKQLTSLVFHFVKAFFLAKNVLMTAQRDYGLGNSLLRADPSTNAMDGLCLY